MVEGIHHTDTKHAIEHITSPTIGCSGVEEDEEEFSELDNFNLAAMACLEGCNMGDVNTNMNKVVGNKDSCFKGVKSVNVAILATLKARALHLLH
jgi:hypothetical protein